MKFMESEQCEVNLFISTRSVITIVCKVIYDLFQRYSAQTKKHFNHSQLHHGKCVTQKCKKYIQDLNETDLISNHHLTTALEGCFNESLWQDYRLKTRVSHVFCVDNKKEVVFDAGDIALGVFIFIVLALNVIGSLYDVVLIKGNKNQGERRLICRYNAIIIVIRNS